MRIGEKIEMRVEGIQVLALPRHHDDEPFPRNAPELGNCPPVIKQVLNDVGTDDRIKFANVEGQILNPRRDIFDAICLTCCLDHEIYSRHARQSRPCNPDST